MFTAKSASKAVPRLARPRHQEQRRGLTSFRPATPYAAKRQTHFLRSIALV